MTFEEARKNNPVYILGSDPGPTSSAFALVRLEDPLYPSSAPEIIKALYAKNSEVAETDFAERFAACVPNPSPFFLAYEKIGFQGKCPGDTTFETAAMGGEIRRAFRPFVQGTYALRSSEWRHPLTGIGGAKTPLVYQELCRFFKPTGGGADPYKGNTKQPGPLWGFHLAGAGGNMEHLKDAAGVALGLSQVRYRSGKDPEIYRLGY